VPPTRLQKRLAKAASEVDLQVMYFNKFGKDAIKSWKISPDAFCQMAMQLAVHSLTGETYPTYESGQTRCLTIRACTSHAKPRDSRLCVALPHRKFLWGRTETVRSVSAESVEFVKAMKRSDLKVRTCTCARPRCGVRSTSSNGHATMHQDSDKLELLRKACNRHTQTNQEACDGLGAPP
jgi:hypothetical protein